MGVAVVTVYLVIITDKSMAGEPDVGMAVVEASSEEMAITIADNQLEALASAGRCRCVVRVRPIEPGYFYRPTFLLSPETWEQATR